MELVYIILKSIIGFSYISLQVSNETLNTTGISSEYDLEAEDTCLKLRSLKIENSELWE